MSQATTWSVPVVSPASPTTMATRIDESLDALLSGHRGGSRPAYAVAGTTWIDDTGTPWIVYTYTGAVDIAIGEINATTEEYIPYIGKLGSNLDRNGFDIVGLVEGVGNLKPVVNAAANKLDIFTKTGGDVPSSTHFFRIGVPDANGITQRTRKASYLSGTSQIVMADGANYWSKGSLSGEYKTAWLYAIWDGTGIVWALAGYSGFLVVPTTTTATDDDYFLLEEDSTYTRNASHSCIAVAKIRYEYDTADTPDHTILASGENAPQVIWNPKSDYARTVSLATTVTAAAPITTDSVVSHVVKQSGKYHIDAHVSAQLGTANGALTTTINVGSATYGAALQQAFKRQGGTAGFYIADSLTADKYTYAGATIHLGIGVSSASGTNSIYGNSTQAGSTLFTFRRID